MLLLLSLLLVAQHVHSSEDFASRRPEYNTSAATYGVIGQTAAAVKNWTDFEYTPNTNGSCDWFGTCFFTADCPEGYDSIRLHNGRCGTALFAKQCVPHGFGAACSNVFGVQKRFCCRRDSSDNTWGGLWRSSETDTKVNCFYHNGDELPAQEKLLVDEDYCGLLSCTRYVDRNIVLSYPVNFEIAGSNCTELRGNSNTNWIGFAEPGIITLFDKDQKKADVWYKYPTVIEKNGRTYGLERI